MPINPEFEPAYSGISPAGRNDMAITQNRFRFQFSNGGAMFDFAANIRQDLHPFIVHFPIALLKVITNAKQTIQS